MYKSKHNNFHKNIKKILFKLNLKFSKCEFFFLNLGKIIILLKEKNKKNIFKIPTDTYTQNLINNEKNGYLNADIKLRFNNLPRFSLLKYTKTCSIGKMNYLGKVKGNYFNFKKFYKELDQRRLKKTNLKNYFNLLKKKNFFSINLFNKDFDRYYKKIINKYEHQEVIMSVSHGDFVHWNTAVYDKDYYVYDLEFFSKERIYIFDKIHWFFLPIIQKLYTYNFFYKSLNKYIFFYFIFYFLKRFIFSNNKKKQFNFYFILYLVEKENYYKNLLLHIKKNKNSTNDYLNRTEFIKNFHTEFLKFLLR